MKGNEQMKKVNQYNEPIIYHDEISKCGIMLNIKDEMYIIRDGKKRRLHAFIIKERKGN